MRYASLNRETTETKIQLNINLDGTGVIDIDTGIGFFNHMLKLFAFHAGIDLAIKAKGDLDVCDHHMVEDVGISMGKAFNKALGDKKGINRYGNTFIPMDETLARVTVDISGRSFLVFRSKFKRDNIGDFSTEMVEEFFRAFSFNAQMAIHCEIMYGENDHHKIEALFKAFGRAIREAINVESGNSKIPSTKGCI